MLLPQLPVEVWTQVFTFLDNKALSSLSQVNKALHRISTSESQFRRMVPIEKDYYTHPMQVFRRRRALHHPPDCCASIAGTSHYDIFCTVQDNLLVVCQWTKEALALPSGVMFNVYELLNEPHLYPGPHPEALEYLQTVYTALPDGCVAFVHREHPSRLVVQSLLENKSRVWKIHRDKSVVARRILGDRSIAAAGDDAQWVVFYSSERCITVFDLDVWANG